MVHELDMNVEHWWNDSEKRKRQYSEETPSSLTLSTTHLLALDRTRVAAIRGQQRLLFSLL
jgi:hypothetical protein